MFGTFEDVLLKLAATLLTGPAVAGWAEHEVQAALVLLHERIAARVSAAPEGQGDVVATTLRVEPVTAVPAAATPAAGDPASS